MKFKKLNPKSNPKFSQTWANFVDYVKIHCKSGHGGAGSAHLRRENIFPKVEPDGGDGGRGGHVIMRGNAQEWTLLHFVIPRHVKAERGENGGKNQLTGAYGADVYINVPIGTIAKNEEGEIIGEIMEDGQEIIIMKGGMGGLGNEHLNLLPIKLRDMHNQEYPVKKGYVVLNSKF